MCESRASSKKLKTESMVKHSDLKSIEPVLHDKYSASVELGEYCHCFYDLQHIPDIVCYIYKLLFKYKSYDMYHKC